MIAVVAMVSTPILVCAVAVLYALRRLAVARPTAVGAGLGLAICLGLLAPLVPETLSTALQQPTSLLPPGLAALPFVVAALVATHALCGTHLRGS